MKVYANTALTVQPFFPLRMKSRLKLSSPVQGFKAGESREFTMPLERKDPGMNVTGQVYQYLIRRLFF